MDPLDPNRPDPLYEPSPFSISFSFLPRLLPYLIAPGVILLLALTVGLSDTLLRPFVLAFGRPASAVVSGKRESHARRAAGYFVELNYQYSRDYAPRPEIQVNNKAYAALVLESNVPIHYLPGCSSCVALDNDYGNFRIDVEALIFIWLVWIVVSWFQKFGDRIRNRP